MSSNRARTVLWTGIALTVVGGILTIFLPNISYYWLGASASAARIDQGFLSVLEVLLRLLATILPLLGVVLIGSSVVMVHLQALLTYPDSREHIGEERKG